MRWLSLLFAFSILLLHGESKGVYKYDSQYHMKGRYAIHRAARDEEIRNRRPDLLLLKNARNRIDASKLSYFECPSEPIQISSGWSFPSDKILPSKFSCDLILTFDESKHAAVSMEWKNAFGKDQALLNNSRGFSGCEASGKDNHCKTSILPPKISLKIETNPETFFDLKIDVVLSDLPSCANSTSTLNLVYNINPTTQPAYLNATLFAPGYSVTINAQNTIDLYADYNIGDEDDASPWADILVCGLKNGAYEFVGTGLDYLDRTTKTKYSSLIFFANQQPSLAADGVIMAWDKANTPVSFDISIMVLYDEWSAFGGAGAGLNNIFVDWSDSGGEVDLNSFTYNTSDPLWIYPGFYQPSPSIAFPFYWANEPFEFPQQLPGRAWTLQFKISGSWGISYNNFKVHEAFPGKRGYVFSKNIGIYTPDQTNTISMQTESSSPVGLHFNISNTINSPSASVQIAVDQGLSTAKTYTIPLNSLANIGKTFYYPGMTFAITINGGNVNSTGTYLRYWISDPTQPTACPYGWTNFQGTINCYKVFRTATFASAEQTCVQNGGNLASIHSQAENNFVIDLASTGIPLAANQQTWIGLSQSNGRFSWTDGTPVDYLNWNAKQPNSQVGACAELVSDEIVNNPGQANKWSSAACSTTMRAFVCKMTAN